jgi:hypothetical protein
MQNIGARPDVYGYFKMIFMFVLTLADDLCWISYPVLAFVPAETDTNIMGFCEKKVTEFSLRNHLFQIENRTVDTAQKYYYFINMSSPQTLRCSLQKNSCYLATLDISRSCYLPLCLYMNSAVLWYQAKLKRKEELLKVKKSRTPFHKDLQCYVSCQQEK